MLSVRYNTHVLDHPPAPQDRTLSALLADLRTEAAQTAAGGGVLAALHALILAALVRLLGRLEHLFNQWQAGLLVTPAQRRVTRAPRPRREADSSVRVPTPARRRATRDVSCADSESIPASAACATNRPARAYRAASLGPCGAPRVAPRAAISVAIPGLNFRNAPYRRAQIRA